MDAADKKYYPFSTAKEPAHFSLACTKVMNTRLLRSLGESHTSPSAKRWEWEMRCPMCESFLGYWTVAVDVNKIKLSANQQRKNRNASLLARSHYKKYHALEKAIKLIQSDEHLASTLAAQSKSTQNSPAALIPPPKMLEQRNQGVKRKSSEVVHPAVNKKSRMNVGVRNKTDSETGESDESAESSDESVKPSEIKPMKFHSNSKQISRLSSKQSNSYPVHNSTARTDASTSVPLKQSVSLLPPHQMLILNQPKCKLKRRLLSATVKL